LAFIYTKAFNGISGLLSLDLQNNNISFLESRLFSNLNQLTTLFLQKNQLRNIELETFDGLASLSYVDLSNNRLRSERGPRLCRSANLRHVYLDDNQLDKIDSCMLASQQSDSVTRTLSLLGNPINCNCSLTWLLRLRCVSQFFHMFFIRVYFIHKAYGEVVSFLEDMKRTFWLNLTLTQYTE